MVKNFSYPAREEGDSFELKEVSFTLKRGTRLGVIGQSGCGKSTLFKLMSGEIFSDAINLEFVGGAVKKSYKAKNLSDLNFLRSQVALISQDSYVFTESLRHNITLGDESFGFDKFWDEIQRKIPYVGTWGVKPDETLKPQEISLGQKQLISALRFCYNPKSIVLFDEISSGLDGNLEKALSDFIDYIQEDAIVIIVAHRVETVVGCERVLFLSKGLQQGLDTHRNLLKKDEKYKEFFTILKGL